MLLVNFVQLKRNGFAMCARINLRGHTTKKIVVFQSIENNLPFSKGRILKYYVIINYH
jgi:hypothetical protein